jgi:hypothetical protein
VSWNRRRSRPLKPGGRHVARRVDDSLGVAGVKRSGTRSPPPRYSVSAGASATTQQPDSPYVYMTSSSSLAVPVLARWPLATTRPCHPSSPPTEAPPVPCCWRGTWTGDLSQRSRRADELLRSIACRVPASGMSESSHHGCCMPVCAWKMHPLLPIGWSLPFSVR